MAAKQQRPKSYERSGRVSRKSAYLHISCLQLTAGPMGRGATSIHLENRKQMAVTVPVRQARPLAPTLVEAHGSRLAHRSRSF